MQHFHKGKPVTAEEHAAAMAERKAEKLISIGELENKIDGAMAYKQKQDEAAAKLASNIKRRAAAEPAASASYLRNPAKALAAPSSLSGHAKVAAFFKSKEAAPVAGSSVKPSATLSGHALVAAYFARQSDPTAPAAQADRTPPELTGLARTSAAFAKLEK